MYKYKSDFILARGRQIVKSDSVADGAYAVRAIFPRPVFRHMIHFSSLPQSSQRQPLA